ncbi:glycosyltransferase family 2 protein [Babjeviella inositovora NRRL Y-12698]|uniref:Chitin synthase n=1 Tax=Babjeviella inositovora NRRL Y-12698 TaxID=984486 RepID=A0A1E3QKF0_9ASCO|nr:glycosyltransferase family 2 protein [Babjeviella inositovora NRRL Y-12698]ODQ78163.1 glycosyltransferase family 2 protein [Babjeviella inositovora NRRL Y-12698]
MKRRPTKLVRKKRKDPADPFQSDEEKKLKYFILDRRFPDLLNTKLASKVDVNNEANKEFTHLRYSAITAAPSTFIRDGFKLRNNLRAFPRETELLIAVTMYNEHDILLGRTLQGIMENIKYMTSLKKSQTWGENSWKKIVVCVISDGRSKINPRAKALMTALGCYQEGFAKSVIDEKEVQAHLFETTSLINIQEVTETKVIFADTAKDIETNIPVQFVFCLKEKNAKKINSHRWFFQSFAKLLDPKITVLLDAGTKPDKKSLYNLWREFKTDENVAGACGEIKAQTGKATYKALLNPIIGAQNFEYKTSNILDKPLESSFGFISVLPGAFSAYRWLALDIDNPDGPLDKYFKGEFLHSNEAPELSDPDYEYKNLQKLKLKSQGIFTQNMYLAEDRILCFELVTAKKHKWVLRYVSSAVGETDVPSRLPEFILQRRRWLNGSFFAGTYSIINFNKFLSSGHSVIRKFFLVIEFIYQIVSLAVSWLSLASFFLVFRILSSATASGSASFTGSYQLSVVFLYLYVFLLVLTILLSFGNSPQGRSTAMIYNFIVGAFACIMIYMLFCIAWLVANFANQLVDYFKMIGGSLTIGDFARVPLLRDLVISLLSTYALYFFGAVLFLDMWHMLWSFWWYILLSPAYTNVLNIYAFCNIHDVSWGTKGDTGGKSLGSVKLDSDSNVANSSPIPDDKEVNKAYVEEMEILNTDFKDEEGSKKEDQVDKFAFVRTAVVVFWMITNFSLVAIVLNVGFNLSTTPSKRDAWIINRLNYCLI